MTDFTRGLDRRTFIFGAAALGAATLLRPTLAFAEPTSADKFAEADSVRARINEMQEQLTIAGENYYKALDEHEAAVQAVADAQARIDEANARIAELQDKLSKRARSMYRSGQTTALDVILGATTFEEFATSWDLLNDINDNDAAMVQQTKDLRAEVEAAKIELEKQERIAAEKPKRRRASKLRQSRPSKRWKPRCNSLTPRLRRCWSRNRKRHVLPKLPLRQPRSSARTPTARRARPSRPRARWWTTRCRASAAPTCGVPPVRTNSTAPDW